MVEQFGLRDSTNNHDNLHDYVDNVVDNNNNNNNAENRNSKSIEMQPLTQNMSDNHNNSNGDKLILGGGGGRDPIKARSSDLEENDGIMIDDDNNNDNDDDEATGGRIHELDKPWNLQDFLYPPQLPPELQLLRKENIAIPACYLLVGILQGLSGPLLNVYPLDLNATEAQQTTISTLKSLPASLKLIFGFISDNFPILGYRRKSYMIIGWCLAACSYGSLLLTTDLTLSEETYEKDDGSIGTNTIAPFGAPSIPFLCLTTFLYGSGE
ncbi:MAG: hypothetical protein ACI90V_008908 [Bacillariaceae sp.]|jgi:hypothetical protein